MKKIFTILSLFLSLFICTSVDAMTDLELKEKLTRSYIVCGTKMQASEDAKVMLDRYMMENKLTQEDIDFINEKFDKALKTANENCNPDGTISEETKKKIKDLAVEASEKTSITIVPEKVDNSIKMTVYNNDGTMFVKPTDPVKNTGSISSSNLVSSVAGISFIITIIGVVFVIIQIKRGK